MRWFILMCTAVLFNNVNGQVQIWELNSSITDLVVGPDTAVHCQLTNPSGTTTFDDFGPCKVNVDRVTAQHSGVWTLNVVQPSNVLPVRQTLNIQVTSAVADSKPTVSTSVQQEKPLIKLTCSVESTEELTACVFRDPSGQTLQARQGVSEDRYSFIERSTTGVQSCGIEINGPQTSDLGLWRCDMQTSLDTYYGHLTVLCPWAMQDPEIAASVVSEPTLTSQTKDQVVSEGDSVTMSCSVQSAIRYCYFRAQNGTIYNVRPGLISSSMEYVGGGFDAGECGVRFPSLVPSDSGAWSCHVGFSDSGEAEQRVQFSILVLERISVSQFVEGNELVVEGVVNENPVLDYCRFVRIDGLGFTSDNVPAGYSDSSSFSQGRCRLLVAAPSMLEHHPWTVVAKVRGQEDELAQSTDHTIEMPPPDGPVTWWMYLVVAGALVVLLVVFLIKRNRRWATDTAAGFRDSFRKNKHPEQEKPPLPA